MIYTNYTLKGKAIFLPTSDVNMPKSEMAQPIKEFKDFKSQEQTLILVSLSNAVKDIITSRPITLKPKTQPKNNIKFIV